MPSGWPERSTAVTVAAGLVLLGCGGDMKQSELADSLDTVASAAGEARLLAQGAADDRTKATFVRVRARELGETLDHEAEKLSDATAGPDVASDQSRAIRLIEDVSAEVDRLRVTPQDQGGGAAAAERLDQLADAVESLREHL